MIDVRPPDDLRELRPRFQLLALGVCVALMALVGRLGQLQILEGEHYTRRAERNFTDVVDVEAPRGRIFDVDGHPLATNRPSYTLYVTALTRAPQEPAEGVKDRTPRRIPMPEEVEALLLSLLGFVDDVDREALATRLEELRLDETEGRQAVPVRRNLTWEEFARIETRAEDLRPWVEIRESTTRYYPEGELGAFVTGYVGQITKEMLKQSSGASYRIGDRVGHSGIERQWENYLRGRLGSRSRVVDSRGREVADPPRHARESLPPDRDPIPGQDIYLTLDVELQRSAFEALARVKSGAVVALEAHSGRILAMVSVPAVDPNRRQQPISPADYESWVTSPFKPFVDKTVQEHFFPGSTYKIVSALAALEDPEFDPDEPVECDLYVTYGGRRFHDLHRCGPVDLHQAIVQSCNVYFYKLAMENSISLERMERKARALGLGERTGLGLNGEVKGRIPTEEFEAREGTFQQGVRLNSAIGQGNVKATILQVAVLYAAIANGGYVMTPYLVDRIMTNDGKLVFSSEPKPKNDKPTIHRDDRERIHRALVGVVNDPSGTAYSQRLPTVTVAGKTGTAQVGRRARKDAEEIEGWDTTQDHAWFVAYGPAEDPQIVVAAFVEHGGVGADAAAPVAMRVISDYLGSAVGDAEDRPRGFGVPPPLPSAAEVRGTPTDPGKRRHEP